MSVACFICSLGLTRSVWLAFLQSCVFRRPFLGQMQGGWPTSIIATSSCMNLFCVVRREGHWCIAVACRFPMLPRASECMNVASCLYFYVLLVLADVVGSVQSGRVVGTIGLHCRMVKRYDDWMLFMYHRHPLFFEHVFLRLCVVIWKDAELYVSQRPYFQMAATKSFRKVGPSRVLGQLQTFGSPMAFDEQ